MTDSPARLPLPSSPAPVSPQPPNLQPPRAPATIVDVPVGKAPAGEALGAVDALLGGELVDVGVRLSVADEHTARAATNRSRMERNAQRLARERMRIGHERARAQLLDRRIAASGPRYWFSWRVRRTGAIVRAIAIKPWQLFKRARSMSRRFRRKA